MMQLGSTSNFCVRVCITHSSVTAVTDNLGQSVEPISTNSFLDSVSEILNFETTFSTDRHPPTMSHISTLQNSEPLPQKPTPYLPDVQK